ncbi:MAG: hypothetical protein ACKODX_04280, partial [Gemmata sp.]
MRAVAAWELRRLARRGHAVRVRLVVLYTLLVAFVAFAAYWFRPVPVRDLFYGPGLVLSPAEVPQFARAFVLALLEAQLAAAVAVTPAVAAAAVAEEKYRQTLPLLLTTLLTDGEIVLGKAVGRVAFVLAAVLAGLPVLLLTQLFGGVEIELIGSACGLTIGTVVLGAAVGVNAACHAPDLRAAALRAYGWVAVLVCGGFVPPLVYASPFAALAVAARE